MRSDLLSVRLGVCLDRKGASYVLCTFTPKVTPGGIHTCQCKKKKRKKKNRCAAGLHVYTPCELSTPNIFAKAVYQRDRGAHRNFRRGQSRFRSCLIIRIKTRSRRKIMFVPLPVPFVFQRTAPDLNAWRLKSPLTLRSNSGKIFLSFLFSFFRSPLCYSSSMSFRLGRADPPHFSRCRCAGSGRSSAPYTHCTQRALSLSLSLTHTHTHTHAHTHSSVSVRLDGVLYSRAAAAQWLSPAGLKANNA